MEVRSISETERSRYLLGLCSPAERERIESEYFQDDVAFQQILTAEDDLIDSYGHGELAGEERRRFEKRFASSLAGRDRVKFARAFARAIAPPRSVESSFRRFQSPVVLRTAMIAATIVFVVLFVWLINDRRRMANEIRELRAESTELSKRTQALWRSRVNQETRTAEGAAQLPDPRAKLYKSRPRESGKTSIQVARHMPEVKNVRSDATLSNSFERKRITELPLSASNPLNLLALHPAITRPGYVAGERTDQSSKTLDRTDVPLNSYPLAPTNNRDATIFIPNSLSWIRFHLTLETVAIHEDYRVTIKTKDDRTVTSVDWTEPLTPNQTIIDTPVISPVDLSPGDYVLVLLGKASDGSFVKLAEYTLKVLRHD